MTYEQFMTEADSRIAEMEKRWLDMLIVAVQEKFDELEDLVPMWMAAAIVRKQSREWKGKRPYTPTNHEIQAHD